MGSSSESDFQCLSPHVAPDCDLSDFEPLLEHSTEAQHPTSDDHDVQLPPVEHFHEVEPAENQPKRKRGRPKKLPIITASVDLSLVPSSSSSEDWGHSYTFPVSPSSSAESSAFYASILYF